MFNKVPYTKLQLFLNFLSFMLSVVIFFCLGFKSLGNTRKFFLLGKGKYQRVWLNMDDLTVKREGFNKVNKTLFYIILVVIALMSWVKVKAESPKIIYLPYTVNSFETLQDVQPTPTTVATECEYCNTTPTVTYTPSPTNTPTMQATPTPECEYNCYTPTATVEPTATSTPQSGVTLEKYASGVHHFGVVVNNSDKEALVSLTYENKSDLIYLNFNKPESIGTTLFMHPGERICYGYYMNNTVRDVGIKTSDVQFYTRPYNTKVEFKSLDIVENELSITLHNTANYSNYGNVYVALYNNDGNLWNCLQHDNGVTIQANDTLTFNLPELYPNGYQFIKTYVASIQF